ncbi:MAG: hypothetical protein J7556_09340 [Acidovorax sp.]|nr:hypothetical protein [Acidovorax sp.]
MNRKNTSSRHPVAAPVELEVSQLSLAINDLDFWYLPPRASRLPTRHSDVVCTVDCSGFYANGADHMVFALDCEGGQGSDNPHCGPIYRHGQNLWSLARGFIIFGDGGVMAERWNGTFSPGLSSIANTSGAVFSPVVNPVFTVRIRAGYRLGALANRMTIEIRAGTSLRGARLFAGAIEGAGWGWDWTGSHRVALAGIAAGFVAPSATGCQEQRLPRSAPDAVLPFSRFQLRLATL